MIQKFLQVPDLSLENHSQIFQNVVNIHDTNSFIAQIIQK